MKSIARFLGIGSDKANQEPTKVILHQVPDITGQEELASAVAVVDETPEGDLPRRFISRRLYRFLRR